MSLSTFTLRLSRAVSDVLLPDLRALLLPDSMQFFSNDLDEQWHYTLICMQSDNACSLAISAIVVWRQLGRINTLHYSNATFVQDVSDSESAELFSLITMPGAVLYIS